MIAHKKEFYGGFAMIISFMVVLGLIFSPLFEGKKNALEYLDALYNSISKGSAYYIPKVKEETDKFAGNSVSVTIAMANEEKALQAASLFKKGGAAVEVTGADLKVSGDLSKILDNCLADADLMYYNKGQEISDKYGYEAKRVVFNWYTALHSMEKDLKEQSKFPEAKVIASVVKKAVETSYNYYEIEPQKISDRLGVVVFSLIFYVGYTLWYGFGIMFMFEGWGMRLEH